MVVATPAIPRHKHRSSTPRREDLQRPPLVSSENDNAAATDVSPLRPPRIKEISSRYLSSFATSSSSSSSISSSYSNGTTYTSPSSSSSMSSRRFPSALVNPRPSSSPALPRSRTPKRSHSVERARPSTLATLSSAAATADAPAEPSAADRALCTTTRCLSVSFQGESFFYQTSRAKTSSPSRARKPTPERRRSTAAAPGAGTAQVKVGDRSENSRPQENHHRRWPSAASAQSMDPFTGRLNCSSEKGEPIYATVRLLQQSIWIEDGTRRASSEGGDLSASSDTESASSGSNSGTTECILPPKVKATPRGISVPARFMQGTNSRLRRLPESTTPSSLPSSRQTVQPKLGLVRKLSMDNLPSPSKFTALGSRGMSSSLRVSNGGSMIVPAGQAANAPSIISFAAEVRRAKRGENRIEEAHLLRLFDNRHLQWRTVNARVNTAQLQRKLIAENDLHSAWMTTSELRDSVTVKRKMLQVMTQNIKITSVLQGQINYLEEWFILEREYSSSLLGATEALRASTLLLPVVGGAKVDVQKVKDAVSSAVDVMQTMASSICSLLSKAEGATSLISEIAKVAAHEQVLLEQARDLLSTVAAMHVTLCCLEGHIIQLRKAKTTQNIEEITYQSCDH